MEILIQAEKEYFQLELWHQVPLIHRTTVIHLEQLSAGMRDTLKTRITGEPNRPARSPEH